MIIVKSFKSDLEKDSFEIGIWYKFSYEVTRPYNVGFVKCSAQ